MLTVLLSGFSGGIHSSTSFGPRESSVLSKIDIAVDIEISSSAVVVSCRLSDMIVRLSYMDYVTVRRVVRDNIGRKLEIKRWDNLEKAWAKEVEGAVMEQEEPLVFSNDVTYSTSARLVRYGQGKDSGSIKKSMRLELSFESLSVVLQRDDVADPSGVEYDMLLVRGKGFELEVGRKEDGDQWLNLSLGKIFVFDLGKVGRLARESRDGGFNSERTDPLSVLVEGYSPLEKLQKIDSGLEFDSQVVVKVDKDASPSGATKVVIVVSYLSITAIVGPLEDVIQFFACAWPVSSPSDVSHSESGISNEPAIEDISECVSPVPGPLVHRTYELRFVSHYPRLVFAADESDPHSRALVLQG